MGSFFLKRRQQLAKPGPGRLQVERFFAREIGNAVAAADIDGRRLAGRITGQPDRQIKGFFLGFQDAVDAQVLGAAENMKTLEVQVQCGKFLQHVRHLLGIDAELFRAAAHFHAGRFQLEIRIDADRRFGPDALLFAKGGSPAHFTEGFHIEYHPGRHRLGKFLVGLGRPGKADQFR